MAINENMTAREQLSAEPIPSVEINPSELEGTPNVESLTDDNSSAAQRSDDSDDGQSQPAGDDTSAGKDGWFDDSLRERASAYGMSEANAEKLGSKEAVESALDFMSNSQLNQGQQAFQQQPMAPPEIPQQFEQAPPEQPQVPQQQVEASFEKFKIEQGDEWGGDVTETMGKMNDHYHDQIAARDQQLYAQQQQLNQMQDYLINQEQQRFSNEMDQRFDSRAEEYGHLAGKGSLNELTQGGPEQQFRIKVAQRMDQYDTMFRSQGQFVSEDFRFNEALRSVINEMGPAAAVQQQQATQPREGNGRFMAAPNQSNHEPRAVTPEQAMDRKLEAWAKERGVPL